MLSGVRGASIGDELTAVDDCPVTSTDHWTQCISDLARRDQRGYCVSMGRLQQMDVALYHTGACACVLVSVPSCFRCVLRMFHVLVLFQFCLCCFVTVFNKNFPVSIQVDLNFTAPFRCYLAAPGKLLFWPLQL